MFVKMSIAKITRIPQTKAHHKTSCQARLQTEVQKPNIQQPAKIDSHEQSKLQAKNQEISSHKLEQLIVDYQMSATYKQQQDGPPRFFSPLIPWLSHKNAQDLPLMIFLPGIDGSGMAGYRQFPRLVKHFEIAILLTPSSDRTPFQDQLAIVKEYLVLEAQSSPISRPIYLLGESYGAVLAMAVAVECRDLVDRIVLVNPASGFPRTFWKQVMPLLTMMPERMYEYFPYAMMPFIANPIAMTSHRVNSQDNPLQQLQQFMQGMVEQLPELDSLKSLLPLDSLAWKVQLLDAACKHMEKMDYKNVKQRTLIIAAGQDLLVPSKEEGERLKGQLARAKLVTLANSSHVILLEAGVDLLNIIKENGFYTQQRNMTSSSDGRCGNNFGAAGPIELPTPFELEKDIEGDNELFSQATFSRMVSPVYFSTDHADRVQLGLDNIPQVGGPFLFVGNHQFMGLDMSFPILKLIQEKGILVRGLAHPTIFMQDEQLDFVPVDLITTYGAVVSTPQNMHSLLNLGESVMLFPGGATEALKKQQIKYKLLWPQQAEFVRMAAKFGATIIPFSSVGLEDSITQIMAAEDIWQVPFVGEYLASRFDEMKNSGNIDPRKWQGNSKQFNEQLALPIAIPAVPSRFYVKFGKPISTQQEWSKDKEICGQIYKEVQSSVEEGLQYLLDKRESDPYKDFVTRLLYEASWNFNKQAPTFVP